MLVDHTGALTFGEIITSPADLKEFEAEIRYKKQLFGYLYGQPTVPFLLISSVDISRTAVVRRLLKEPDNVLLTTPTCEDLKGLIRQRDLKRSPTRRIKHEKLISIKDIPPRRPFDYKKLHDERMQSIIAAVTSKKGVGELGTPPDEIPPIVKKVIFGGGSTPPLLSGCSMPDTPPSASRGRPTTRIRSRNSSRRSSSP
ncbi:hypothetical protein [Methanoculleus chikugoensis]|uniref:hypothetical protein n=1 Tax=Methanoculleus chikugoensis TaxID=118126 RepID=UPI000A8B0B30|nr:hypothetical protein [Methanoculleus chikugoensis]